MSLFFKKRFSLYVLLILTFSYYNAFAENIAQEKDNNNKIETKNDQNNQKANQTNIKTETNLISPLYSKENLQENIYKNNTRFYAKILASIDVLKQENVMKNKPLIKVALGGTYNIGSSKRFFISPEVFSIASYNPIKIHVSKDFFIDIDTKIKEYKVVKNEKIKPAETFASGEKYTDLGQATKITINNIELGAEDFQGSEEFFSSHNFISHNGHLVQADSVSRNAIEERTNKDGVKGFTKQIFGNENEAWLSEEEIQLYGEHGEGMDGNKYYLDSAKYQGQTIENNRLEERFILELFKKHLLNEEAYDKLKDKGVFEVDYNTYKEAFKEGYVSSVLNKTLMVERIKEFSKEETKDVMVSRGEVIESIYDLTEETRYVNDRGYTEANRYTGYIHFHGAFGVSLRFGVNLFNNRLALYVKPNIGISLFKKGAYLIYSEEWKPWNNDSEFNSSSMEEVAYDIKYETSSTICNIMYGAGFGADINLTDSFFITTEFDYNFLPYKVQFGGMQGKPVTLKGEYNMFSLSLGAGIRF